MNINSLVKVWKLVSKYCKLIAFDFETDPMKAWNKIINLKNKSGVKKLIYFDKPFPIGNIVNVDNSLKNNLLR